MAKAVKLSDHLVDMASSRAKAMSRSVAGQVEYWAKVGQIAEDNPDLPFLFIRDILIGMEEAKSKQVEDYVFAGAKKKEK